MSRIAEGVMSGIACVFRAMIAARWRVKRTKAHFDDDDFCALVTAPVN